SGAATVLPDAQGRSLLPSIVRYLPGGKVDAGYAAQAQQADDPKNSIASVKRYMGRGLKDVAHAESAPYDFVDAPGMVQLRTAAGVKSPVEVSAEILKVLRARAEKSLNGTYAVFDLGGGTFDISILRLSRGVFEVIATNGDAAPGGDDWDQRVFCWIVEEAKLAPLAPRDMRALLVKAREAKEYLTGHGEAHISARLSSGEYVDVRLDTETFSRITQHLVDKTLAPARKALRDAGLTVAEVKGVVMVGGATRMPQIQRAAAEFFRRDPLNNLDPDKVVALGAAMQANVLA